MKVLLIDDDDDIRRIASLVMERVAGMEVSQANNGTDGLQKAAAEKPDVILLDVMMPGMDGPDTLAALRANPATADIPVIFLTAKVMASEIERLKKLGTDGVLIKPFDALTLATHVRALLEDKYEC